MKTIFRNENGAKEVYIQAYDRTLQEWDVPVESTYLDTSFGKTHILISGPADAEPLILFHGFGFSSTMWIENVKPLSKYYRTFAVDFIGDINKSEAIRQITSKEECASWFREILSGLGIERAHVAGLSYGGFISLVLAVYAPQLINKMVVMCPAASFQPQSKKFLIKCLLAGIFPTTKRLNNLMNDMIGKGNQVNEILKDQFITGMQNALPTNKLFPSYMKDDELRAIQCPILLLIGDQDIQYDPQKAIARAKHLVPLIQTKLIADTGHGLAMERPKTINALMITFFKTTANQKYGAV
ncbi:alpha/beta fold hydrolase [Paenibacillus planticolens]|uniref:Alpha/beta fold hydrolase n=1 Tax=Paenibacillus planticolens TaxID=2654976 RepID=A0ABX1ZQS5_9BACL|nr:alpha/beta hydrolase [Paenibacillus planticolens]NOV02286.1 alpha/beta fold hydrolase [Paenibacillus planticolens]